MATARLATAPAQTTRATSGTVETCRLTRSWNKTFGRVRWLLATDDTEPSLHIDEAYEGAQTVKEQLRTAAKAYFVDIDALRQGNVRDIPLVCEWQTERRGLDDVRVCTKVRAIDRNFPQWGLDEPDKFNLLLTELNAGAALYNETLGYDRRRWPAYDECKRRMLDKLAVKEEKIIPFARHKDVPDAKDNPDWSIALGKAANMGEAKPRNELDEALDRKPDGTPADDATAKQHETNPDKVPFAVSNHIKRETGITAGIGTFITKIFAGGLDAAKVQELGADQVWTAVEKAVAEYNAAKNGKPLETPKNGTSVEIRDTTSTTSKVEEKTQEPASSFPIEPTPSIQEKSQPSAVIPYQPRAVAHTLNVDWKITPLEMAQFAVQSGLYAGINSPAKAMVVMMRGLELGVSPLTALEQVNIIQGKTVVSSALFLALIERSGQLENMVIDDSRPDACTVTLTRRGRSPISATFTMDDAAKMGLANKDNWRKMPKTMLYHRALGVAGRRAFSDVLLFGGGIYMPEEMSPDTIVDENGEVIAA